VRANDDRPCGGYARNVPQNTGQISVETVNLRVSHEILDGFGLGQALERRYLVNRSQMGVSPGGGDIAML
jgi:hypothetical protein